MLKKAMYDMIIYGKYWYAEFRDWLISVAFIQYETCPVLFTKHESYIVDGLSLPYQKVH
jgi:hypothetical protein